MEYQYIDIEAHIRHAQKLRSDALGDILSALWKTCAQWVRRLANHPLHTPAAWSRRPL